MSRTIVAPHQTAAAARLGAGRSIHGAGPTSTSAVLWGFRGLLYGGCLLVFLEGDTIGRAMAVAAAVFGFIADCDGFARHALRTIGLALACMAGAALGPLLGAATLAGHVSPLVAKAAGAAGVGLLTLLLVAWLGRIARRRLRRRPALARVDNGLGLVLGLVEGAAVVASVFWALALFRQPLTEMQTASADVASAPPTVAALNAALGLLDETPTGRALSKFNPLDRVGALHTLSQTAEAIAQARIDPESDSARALRAVLEAPAIKERLRVFHERPELREAVERRDFVTLLRSDAFAEMAADPAVYEAVMASWAELSAAFAAPDSTANPPAPAQSAPRARVP
jgi:uncharacterized membrane protein required for colicin V production